MITSFVFESPQPLPVARIREQLETLPTVARDRWDGDVYVVTDDAATLRFVRNQRDKNQLGFPRVVVLVRLYESRVDFSLQSISVETARNFALWMRDTFSLAILDDSSGDITSKCDANLDYLFEPKGDVICVPNIHTDGVYAWPEDLAFYVERYHVALPAAFLEHLASAKWTVPANVDLASVELR